MEAALDAAKSTAQARLGGRSSGSRGGSSGSGSQGGKDEVIELTDSNFDKLVLQSEDLWLVEFFAPWCGHCKNLAPEWSRASVDLKGEAKLGKSPFYFCCSQDALCFFLYLSLSLSLSLSLPVFPGRILQ